MINQAQVESAVLSLGSFHAVKTARLAEEVARVLGQDSAESFGVYASGKPILAAILGQALKKLEAQAAAGASPAATPPPPGATVAITSDAEYDALPSGTMFKGPDGKVRRKP